jgi:hypothetical protein
MKGWMEDGAVLGKARGDRSTNYDGKDSGWIGVDLFNVS